MVLFLYFIYKTSLSYPNLDFMGGWGMDDHKHYSVRFFSTGKVIVKPQNIFF